MTKHYHVFSAASSSQKLRPFSANFSTSTPKVESSVRETRVASAGTSRVPFVRPSIRNSLAASKAQTADCSKPVTSQNNWATGPPVVSSSLPQSNGTNGTVNATSNTSYHTGHTASNQPNIIANKPQHLIAAYSETGDVQKNSSSVTAADIRKSLEGAVHEANGIRLDRTPTDEEINWLWHKVRTCLSRQSTVDSIAGDNHSERAGSASVQPRQTVQVSNTYIDGTTLNPQLRTSTRTFANYNGNANTNEVSTVNSTYPSKKISMDTLNTYNRRTNSATQKKSSAINNVCINTNSSTYSNGNNTAPYNTYGSSASMFQQTQQPPAQSKFGPTPSPSMAVVSGYNGEGKNFTTYLTALAKWPTQHM